MWSIKILTGDGAGKKFKLKSGSNTVGRAADCDITIARPGISKQHARIEVYSDRVVISDLNSSNGTFVNGLKIKEQELQPRDKITFYDVIVEFRPAKSRSESQIIPMPTPMTQNYDGNLAYQQQPEAHYPPQAEGAQQEPPTAARGPMAAIRRYIDDVILSGVYKLPEWFEFKMVIAAFMLGFVFAVTFLSSIPLVRILKESIEQESRSHATAIAEYMAASNRTAISQGIESSINVQSFAGRPSVISAMVIELDGRIIAPARNAGQAPDQSYIQTCKTSKEPIAKNINDQTVIACAPIIAFNEFTGIQSAKAYAVIVYDMGSLAAGDSRVLSLLIQTFFIALIIGGILYFFLYKMVEYPFVAINRQLDKALSSQHGQVESAYQFPALQRLVSYINSAISRMADSGSEMSRPVEYNRTAEMNHIIEVMGQPAMAINARDMVIEAANPQFSNTTGIAVEDILQSQLAQLSDHSLKLNIQDLIEQLGHQPDSITRGQLEFGGINYDVTAQAVYGLDKVAFYIIVLVQSLGEGDFSYE